VAARPGADTLSRPVILDVLIAVVVLVAVFVGFQRGLIQPLLIELLVFLTLFLFLHDRNGYLAFMERALHANAVLAIFLVLIVAAVAAYAGARIGGLIHRMPVVRGADGFFGVFVQGFLAILVCYVFLSALVAMDKAFNATATATSLTVAQVQVMQKQLAANQLVSGLVDSRDFKRLQDLAKRPGGASISQAPQLNQLATAYEDVLQPQLSGSRLAPVVLGIGQRVPGVGKFGPRDLPRRTPKATPVPSPTPKK
jgi:uncharacterized membrane protein required for colicin V production